MINQATTAKLREMHLSAMADAFQDQVKDPAHRELSFEERFGLLVDAEWTSRKHNRLQKLMKLASCSYINENHNVIIMGASGNGKSWLACALGIAACQHYYPVKYIRLPELLDEFAIARGTGTFKKVIKLYKSVRLLILDEWLLTPLVGQEAHDLLEIIEARHHVASTIFCSQFKPGGWHEKIGQDTLADAILDRIIHDSYQIYIDGKVSMRERKGLKKEDKGKG